MSTDELTRLASYPCQNTRGNVSVNKEWKDQFEYVGFFKTNNFSQFIQELRLIYIYTYIYIFNVYLYTFTMIRRTAAREAGDSHHQGGGRIKPPWKPSNITTWWGTEGFKGALNCAPLVSVYICICINFLYIYKKYIFVFKYIRIIYL